MPMASVEETLSATTPSAIDSTVATDTTAVPTAPVVNNDTSAEFFARVAELCKFCIVNEKGDIGKLAAQIMADMNAA